MMNNYACRGLAIGVNTFAALKQNRLRMNKEKYVELFAAFAQAPMEEFLKTIFKGVSADIRNQIVLEDVAYHRHSANVVALDAWMCVAPIEANQWILARVEMDCSTGKIEELFLARDSYQKQPLRSIEECVEYYKSSKG